MTSNTLWVSDIIYDALLVLCVDPNEDVRNCAVVSLCVCVYVLRMHSF